MRRDETDAWTALPHTPQELFTEEFLSRLANPTGTLAEVLATDDNPCEWRSRF